MMIETYSYPCVCYLLHEKLLQNVNTNHPWCSCWLSTFILLFCGFILLCYVLDEPSELKWPDVPPCHPTRQPQKKIGGWGGWGGRETKTETREFIPIVSTLHLKVGSGWGANVRESFHCTCFLLYAWSHGVGQFQEKQWAPSQLSLWESQARR